MSFYTAARDGQIDMLREMIQAGTDVSQRFNEDRTALHFACDGGHVECVRMLLENRAMVNDADSFNKDTPLHLAAEGGHTEVVELLLVEGANPNVQDRMNGETPLHLACEGGHSGIVSLLLSNGANTGIKNAYGKEAVHYATHKSTRGEFEKFERIREGGGRGEGGGVPAQNQGNTQHTSPSAHPSDSAGLGLESDLRETVAALAAVSAVPSAVTHYDQATAVRVQDGQRPFDRAQPMNGSSGRPPKDTGTSPEKRAKAWHGVWSIGGVSSSGDKKENQDSYLCLAEVGGDPGISLFGIFDGHGARGDAASGLVKHAAETMLNVAAVRKAANSFDGDIKVSAISDELNEMFVKLQALMSVQVDFDASASGCTGLVALFVDGDAYLANAGDSRAVLAHACTDEEARKDGREKLSVTQVSVDHVPSIRAERERIESMGGMVRREGDALTGEHGPYRVWRKDGHGPGLAMSRSLGDLNAHKVGVTCTPDVKYMPKKATDRFLLLASDGVWDMLSNAESVDIAARGCADCKGDPSSACRLLCETARRAWEFKETRIDDITCIAIFLPVPSPAPQPLPDPQLHQIPAGPAYEVHQSQGSMSLPQTASYPSSAPLPPGYNRATPEVPQSVPSASPSYSRSPYVQGAERQPHQMEGYRSSPSVETATSYKLPSLGPTTGLGYRATSPAMEELSTVSPEPRVPRVGENSTGVANTSALSEWTSSPEVVPQKWQAVEEKMRASQITYSVQKQQEPAMQQRQQYDNPQRQNQQQMRPGGGDRRHYKPPSDPFSAILDPLMGGGGGSRNGEDVKSGDDCAIM